MSRQESYCDFDGYGEEASHSMLNPIGAKFDRAICDSLDHVWGNFTFPEADVAEIRFRNCSRCYRSEIFIRNEWHVAEVRPCIA